MGLPKNPCAKTAKINSPYEIWVAPGWEWRVLKKYQSPENEAKNPYARWFCAVKGPGTFDSYDMGDTYVKDITDYGTRLPEPQLSAHLEDNQWHQY